MCSTHSWVNCKTFYVCQECGTTSSKQPDDYEETQKLDINKVEEERCRHVWECLRDRCHNRGKGKYQAYKCKLCGKFQRR